MMATMPLPFVTANSLGLATRRRVIELLGQRLADVVDLGTQAKQAHWNVKGPQFSALHLLFDGIHAAVDGYVDLLAERVVQLGGVAQGTVRQAAKRSALREYPAAVDGMEHVHAMTAALATAGALMRDAVVKATRWEDPDSADICTEISRGLDKWLWMVEAHGQGTSSASA